MFKKAKQDKTAQEGNDAFTKLLPGIAAAVLFALVILGFIFLTRCAVTVAPAPPKTNPSPPPQLPDKPPPSTSTHVAIPSDLLFAYDHSDIQPAGIEALRSYAQKIVANMPASITVTGHTDRIGTPEYNRRLSLDRAESVKRAMQSDGITTAQIRTLGVGADQPKSGAPLCQLVHPREALRECLAPHRRVEIQVFYAQSAEHTDS